MRIHQVEKHSLVKIDYILVRIRSLSLILSPTLLAQLCDSLSARQFTPGRSSQSQVTRQTDRQANETTAPGGIRIQSCNSTVSKMSSFQPKIVRCEETKGKLWPIHRGKKATRSASEEAQRVNWAGRETSELLLLRARREEKGMRLCSRELVFGDNVSVNRDQ